VPQDQPGPIAGLVLAAGSSLRMGRNKLLLTLNGETIVRRAARQTIATLDPVVVVLGHEAEVVRGELAGLPCRTTVNPDHAQGFHTSLRAGLAALPPNVDAVVVVLADMPLVTPAMLAQLVERYRQSGAPLVVSQYGDTLAPPHLYSRRFFSDLAQSEASRKQVIRRYRADAVVLSWPATALSDLDVPADRERVEVLLAGES
jgi:molybdenum cofactor cytidylyltransferase